jgi:peptidoglycan/xylan/chitin deacetylase (PgdA/CDA1 family)
VLGLEDALTRLFHEDLPPRSVVITFDDGFYDFLSRAHPVLIEHGYPATVYLTTYYSEPNRPIFRLMCSYLLWLRRESAARPLTLADKTLLVRTSTPEERNTTLALIDQEVEASHLTAQAKHAFIVRLAESLKIDLASLSAQRILHLLAPDEIRTLSTQGVDVQLHTHRHRSPRDERLFAREILDNRECVQAATGKTPRHFCYPSGVHQAEFPGWLRRLDVISATTCDDGLCTPRTNHLLLPRYLDQETFSDLEFESWVTGAAAIGRRR